MIARPYPVISDGCVNQVPVEQYHPPRIAIGPDTREILIDIDRGMAVGHSTQDDQVFVLELTKWDPSIPPDGAVRTVTLTSNLYLHYRAHFAIANSVALTMKGLWRGQVTANGCCIGEVEVVKAPSFAVQDASTFESRCAANEWVEPPCTEADKCMQEACGCDTECEDVPCPSCNIPAPCALPTRSGYGV